MIASVITTYIGNLSVPSGQGYFEWKGSTSTIVVKPWCCNEGSNRVAMRRGTSSLYWLLGDHLGARRSPPTAAGRGRGSYAITRGERSEEDGRVTTRPYLMGCPT